MSNRSLATSLLLKARTRLLVLELLLREQAHSDVVRGAQELVEMALKALLRQAGIRPRQPLASVIERRLPAV